MLIHKCQRGSSSPFSQIGRKLRQLPLVDAPELHNHSDVNKDLTFKDKDKD